MGAADDATFLDKVSAYFFDVWNIIDLFNIISMLCYFHYYNIGEENTAYGASAYSFMVLFTWIDFMQYLRLYDTFRLKIDMVRRVFMSGATWKFMVIMIIFLVAFGSA